MALPPRSFANIFLTAPHIVGGIEQQQATASAIAANLATAPPELAPGITIGEIGQPVVSTVTQQLGALAAVFPEQAGTQFVERFAASSPLVQGAAINEFITRIPKGDETPMALDLGGILQTVSPFLGQIPGVGSFLQSAATFGAQALAPRPSAFTNPPVSLPSPVSTSLIASAGVPAVVAAGGAVARAGASAVAQAASRLRQVLGNNWGSAAKFILQTSGTAYLANLIGMGSNHDAVTSAVVRRSFRRSRRGISARDIRISNRTIRKMMRFQSMLKCSPKSRRVC